MLRSENTLFQNTSSSNQSDGPPPFSTNNLKEYPYLSEDVAGDLRLLMGVFFIKNTSVHKNLNRKERGVIYLNFKDTPIFRAAKKMVVTRFRVPEFVQLWSGHSRMSQMNCGRMFRQSSKINIQINIQVVFY